MKQIPNFYSVNDIEREYNRTDSGHWFDKDTMKFFKSKLTSHFKKLDDMTYLFISTEKKCFNDNTRVANIRVARIIKDESFYGFKVHIESFDRENILTLSRAITKMSKLTLEDVNYDL